MATMWPNTVSPNTKSNAEKQIFKRLQIELNENWYVIHSLPLSTVKGKPWAEIDFVLIGPPGIFCIEVKGGRVSYNHENKKWLFTNKYGTPTAKSEGPFEQATSGMYGLLEHFQKNMPADQIPLIGCGVMVPDSKFDSGHIDEIPQILYDNSNLNENIRAYVDRMSAYWNNKFRKKKIIDEPLRKQIIHTLKSDLMIMPSINTNIDYVKGHINIATEEQKRVIEGFKSQHRVLVEGGPGTGKTMCAGSEAVRIANEGKKVLYTCYNRRLASMLKREMATHNDNIDVHNIDELMVSYIKDALGYFPSLPEESWRENIILLASDAITQLGLTEYYDAIIIDEGQDLLADNLMELILGSLLKDGITEGCWRLFMDGGQNIFDASEEDCFSRLKSYAESQYTLNLNCRNTTQIFEATGQLCSQYPDIYTRVDGPATELHWYNKESEALEIIGGVLNKLVVGGVSTSQIAILSPRTLPNSLLSNVQDDLQMAIVSPDEENEPVEGEIGFYTIQSFKGLEADVVLLTDLTNLLDDKSKAYNYVGGSRATTTLHFFIPESERNGYEKNYMNWVTEHHRKTNAINRPIQ